MAIQVGSMVRVKEVIEHSRINGIPFTEEMERFKGKEFLVIEKNTGGFFKLDRIHNMGYWYSEEWIEEVEGGFKVGDYAFIKDFEEMAEQYGMCGNHVKTMAYFVTDMQRYCGKKVRIEAINPDGIVTLTFDEPMIFGETFTIDMLRRERSAEVIAPDATTFDFEKATNDALGLFSQYKYLGATPAAVKKIITTAYENKRNVRAILRKHPNWDENQQAVIFSEEFEAGINKKDLNNAISWFAERICEKFKETRKVEFDYDRYDKLNHMRSLSRSYMNNPEYAMPYVMEALKRQYNEIKEEYETMSEVRSNITFDDYADCTLTCADHRELASVRGLLYRISDSTTSLIDEGVMRYVNGVNEYWKTNAKVGQKISRLAMKVFKHYGIDSVKIMKSVMHNGTEEMKDFGFNYYFAMFGDAINPVHIKKYTVISVNPLDFWTMSFGKNWSSCQTLDKLNIRQVNSSHYHGQSSSGTESYMLDKCTVIFYTVDESYQGEMWKADKDRRMNFHVAKDGKFMIFGRLYPDGRDGGETGLGAQFRKTIQKVLSECTGDNNLWKVESGTVGDYAHTIGTHYPDYHKYGDTGICYISGTEPQTLLIGHSPICPHCGEEHRNCESVFCERHHIMDVKKCDHCGATILDEEEAIYCEDNDCWYCCGECAEDEHVYYCEDDNAWHTEDYCLWDNYAQKFYHDRSEMVVIGNFRYANESNAASDGWIRNEEGNWKNPRHRVWERYL